MRCCGSWPRRSAPTAPRSSASIRSGSSTTSRPAWSGRLPERFRGQRQRWFALRFLGEDADIRLDADPHVEFDAWRWVPLAEVPALAVPFKRAIYVTVAVAFARFAARRTP